MLLTFTFKQMINSGMHIGHTIQNTLLLASWLLFKYRQNIWFINLQISLKMFKIAFKILKFIIGSFGPIWFVNLDKSVEKFISHTAKICGEFFCSSWVNGIISNFRFVAGKLKKERENENRFKRKNFNLMCDFWYLTRYSSPRLIFSFSAFKSASAISEALAYGIPCIAIVDTNVKSQAIALPIPGNDDSLDSIIFYNEIISSFVLKCKFGLVLVWFSSIRKSFRVINFKSWLKKRKKEIFFVINNNNQSNAINNKFFVNYERLFSRSFISFFSQSYWLSQNLNKFRYFYAKSRIVLSEKISKKLLLNSQIYFKLIRIYFIKVLNFTKFFFRKRRKIIQKVNKRQFFCKLLMKFKGASFFINGGFVRKYLGKNFKEQISKKNFFWNLCYLFYNNIRFSRQIFHSPQNRKIFVNYSEWFINKNWSLSSEYNSNILGLERNINFKEFTNKSLKMSTSLKKKTKFDKKLQRILNHTVKSNKNLNTVILLKDKQKFLNFAIYNKFLKKNLLSRLFLDLWVRLSLTQLGLKLSYKPNLGSSLKSLKALFHKLKMKNKLFKLSSKNNLAKLDKNNFTKRLKFRLGYFSFTEILPFFFFENNKNFLYNDKIHFSNFWYFWRFYRFTFSFKALNNFYMGPGFYLNRFNLFYRRKKPLIESLDYSIFKSINIFKKSIWKKGLKLRYPFKIKLKLTQLNFILTLDKRFDIVRRTHKKFQLKIENLRTNFNAKTFKTNRTNFKFNRTNFNRKEISKKPFSKTGFNKKNIKNFN